MISGNKLSVSGQKHPDIGAQTSQYWGTKSWYQGTNILISGRKCPGIGTQTPSYRGTSVPGSGHKLSVLGNKRHNIRAQTGLGLRRPSTSKKKNPPLLLQSPLWCLVGSITAASDLEGAGRVKEEEEEDEEGAVTLRAQGPHPHLCGRGPGWQRLLCPWGAHPRTPPRLQCSAAGEKKHISHVPQLIPPGLPASPLSPRAPQLPRTPPVLLTLTSPPPPPASSTRGPPAPNPAQAPGGRRGGRRRWPKAPGPGGEERSGGVPRPLPRSGGP